MKNCIIKYIKVKNGFKKMGKQLISHRYNLLPLLPSEPGGVQRELVV